MIIRTRFAPSPTGFLHIGGARTALFNWLYAKHHNGEFILRIEDTDKVRSKTEFTQDIFNSLSWLGITHDLEPLYQSKRIARYKEVIQQLLDQGDAYHCYCTKERLEQLRKQQMENKLKPRYDGFCRDLKKPPSTSAESVVRFKNPFEGSVLINDQVKGKVEIQNSELDDLVLARSDGSPTYHLCVVVDDLDSAITNVIRGDDHLNNTPRQINIFNALNKEAPTYAHIPLIHGKDGKRLSKRHGAVSINQFREEGILSQSLLSYLVRLGWSHSDQELFTVDQMIELFDVRAIQKSAATFDYDKLAWVNHQNMKDLNGSSIRNLLEDYFNSHNIELDSGPDIAAIYDLQKERCKTLQDLTEASVYFYQEFESYEETAVDKFFTSDGLKVLESLRAELGKLESWSAEVIHEKIKTVAQNLDLKFAKVAPPLRLAVTGCTKSPSIDATLELLGADKSLYRIDKAIEYIKGNS